MRRFMTRNPRADADWRTSLGKTDTFDPFSEEQPTPQPGVPRLSVRMMPWPPRASEGFARSPCSLVRAGRFRTLG
jgi:hypothetical protein